MQRQILNKNPEADLRVYAVWFNMVPADTRRKWPDKLLTDPRVIHYWDEGKVVGRWYGENVTAMKPGHVEWDAYFLYGPEVQWKQEPPPLTSWGRTIVATREDLRRDLASLLRR